METTGDVFQPQLHSFSEALTAAKLGMVISRIGWNGKTLRVRAVVPKSDRGVITAPFLCIAHKEDLTPWVPSQSDLWASDWVIEYPLGV